MKNLLQKTLILVLMGANISFASNKTSELPKQPEMINITPLKDNAPSSNSLNNAPQSFNDNINAVKKNQKKKNKSMEVINHITLNNSTVENPDAKNDYITLERYKQIKNIVRANQSNVLFIQNKATYLVEIFNFKDKLIHTLKIQPAYQTRAEDTEEIPYVALCMKEGNKLYNDYDLLETGLILETGYLDDKKIDRFLSVDFSFLWKMSKANTGDCDIDVPKVAQKKFMVNLPLIIYEEQSWMQVRDYKNRLFKFKITRLK